MTATQTQPISPRTPTIFASKGHRQLAPDETIRMYLAKKSDMAALPQYQELTDIITDEWDATTIVADWSTDFPGIQQPKRKWSDIILTLCAIHNASKDGKKATGEALKSKKEGGLQFPFGIDISPMHIKAGHDQDEHARTTLAESCRKCGLDTKQHKYCSIDGANHHDYDHPEMHHERDTSISPSKTMRTIHEPKITNALRQIGENLDRYAEAFEAAGFDSTSKLDGVSPENLIAWISPHVEGTLLPGDAMIIINAVRKDAKKKKDVDKEDSEYDVSTYPEILKRSGPEVLINTLYRKLGINNNDIEKKKLFGFLENWIRMVWRRKIFLENTDENQDMWILVQDILNQIRALDLSRQGKPGAALLAQMQAKKKNDELGAAVAAWDARTKKTEPRNTPSSGSRNQKGPCYNCGRMGHTARECRSKKDEKKEKGKPGTFPSNGAPGRAGL